VISDHQIQAVSVSVPDLHEQALKFLVGSRRADLDRLLPLKTSRERYLLADKPVRGYYMEAHKDYKNAVAHLSSLVKKSGIELKYLR